MDENRILVDNLTYRIDKKDLIKGISLAIANKEFVGLIGPNGSGKSTLLKNIYKQYEAEEKERIWIDNKPIELIKNKDLARKMAVVTQESSVEFEFSVWEMMQLSRIAYRKIWQQPSKKDFDICEKALIKVGMLDMKERSFASLSGGEKQRVYLAMAFAQETEIIVLDEPTNNLDIGYQLMIMEMLKNEKDLTIFTSFHDMNLAFRFCDRIIVLDKGQIVAMGKPKEVITKELLRDIFHIDGVIYQGNEDEPMHIFCKSYSGKI